MGVLFKKFESHFTQIMNVCFFDKRLTYTELGLYCQLCSLPDYWIISINRLNNLHGIKNNKHIIADSMNNLIKYGYINRDEPLERLNEKGKFESYDYSIYPSPFDNSKYDYSKIPNELIKTYNDWLMNNQLTQPVPYGDGNLPPMGTVTIPYGDSINNNLIKTNINIVVDKERFINAISETKNRYDEAYRTEEYSNRAIQYAIDSFNCFGEDQIKKINNLEDKDYIELFTMAFDFANELDNSRGIINDKKVFSTKIKSLTRKVKTRS